MGTHDGPVSKSAEFMFSQQWGSSAETIKIKKGLELIARIYATYTIPPTIIQNLRSTILFPLKRIVFHPLQDLQAVGSILVGHKTEALDRWTRNQDGLCDGRTLPLRLA